MSESGTTTRTETNYEYVLEHEDVVDMMNDANLQEGAVDESQVFTLYLRKPNGSDIILKDMSPTDRLVFKFVEVTIESS